MKHLESLRVPGRRNVFSFPLPRTPQGLAYQCCPKAECSPREFRRGPATTNRELSSDAILLARRAPGEPGVTCPYCGEDGPDQAFVHGADVEAATAHVTWAVEQDLRAWADGLFPKLRRLKNVKVTHRPAATRPRPNPRREDLLRIVECDICACAYGVYAHALFCPECGARNLHVHVDRELSLVRGDLSSANARGDRERAFRAVANAVEDTVSILEGHLKLLYIFLVRRRQPNSAARLTSPQAMGNRFQNVDRGGQLFAENLGFDPFGVLAATELDVLRNLLGQRHVITHNLGVADQRYSAADTGKTIEVNVAEVEVVGDLCRRVLVGIEEHAPEFRPPRAGDR